MKNIHQYKIAALVVFTVTLLLARDSFMQVADAAETKRSKVFVKANQPVKVMTRSAIADSAAIQQIHQGLERINSRLRDAQKINRRFKTIKREYVKVKVRQAELTRKLEPARVKRPKEPVSARTADSQRELKRLSQEIRNLNRYSKGLTSQIELQARSVQQEFHKIEDYVRLVEVRRNIPQREMKGLVQKMEMVRDYIAHINVELDESSGDGLCMDRISEDCGTSECENCCIEQNPVTAAPDTELRALQEALRDVCIDACEIASNRCQASKAFQNSIEKAEEAINLLSNIMKEMQK